MADLRIARLNGKAVEAVAGAVAAISAPHARHDAASSASRTRRHPIAQKARRA